LPARWRENCRPYRFGNLAPAIYAAIRKTVRGESIKATGGAQRFKAPFDGDAVLYLKKADWNPIFKIGTAAADSKNRRTL
jgi:hypothetical protein